MTGSEEKLKFIKKKKELHVCQKAKNVQSSVEFNKNSREAPCYFYKM